MARQTSSEWEAEMADEGKLARLEAEIERLRAALEKIADMDPDNRHLSIRQVQDIAIVALEQKVTK